MNTTIELHAVRLVLDIALDSDTLHAQAERRGVAVDVVIDEVIGDIEGRLHGACWTRAGVVHATVTRSPLEAADHGR